MHCSKPTTTLCSRCDMVCYCSTRCEKKDRERHSFYECSMNSTEHELFVHLNKTLALNKFPLFYKHTGTRKGFGLFSACNFTTGDVLFKETAFMFGKSHEILKKPVIHHPTHVFVMFWSLFHDTALKTVTEREISVVKRNAIIDLAGNNYLHFIISRFNHSCLNNVSTHMFSNPTHAIFATKPIRKGDELTLPFFFNLGVESPSVRCLNYKEIHNTFCACEICMHIHTSFV